MVRLSGDLPDSILRHGSDRICLGLCGGVRAFGDGAAFIPVETGPSDACQRDLNRKKDKCVVPMLISLTFGLEVGVIPTAMALLASWLLAIGVARYTQRKIGGYTVTSLVRPPSSLSSPPLQPSAPWGATVCEGARRHDIFDD